MKELAFWTATAGAAFLAACGQPESVSNAAADNVMEAAPANMAAPVAAGGLNQAVNMVAAEDVAPQAGAAAEPRAEPASKARPESARPAPRERPPARPAPRPAPKQEPAPASTDTCTPEHEAMGHCKQ